MKTILDGKTLAGEISTELKLQTATFTPKPKLVVIKVGNDQASEVYVRNKQLKAAELGIDAEVLSYDEISSEKSILDKIEELNNDKNVNAILVQLPLPKHISETNVINKIMPQKDVDGFTFFNAGKIATGQAPYAYPCTPKGVITMLERYNINLEGMHVVIIGRSNIVGKPLAQMCLNKNATVTIAHSKTKSLQDITKTADVLISCVGKAKFITKEYIKQGAVVVDVGINRNEAGKLCGDVDFDNVLDIVSAISPVPKGVGAMTIISLMQNTIELYKQQRNN